MPTKKASKKSAYNQSQIFHLVYREGAMARPEIARRLGVSLPTVMQGVKELVEKELLEEGNNLASTGGRKAVGIQCAANSKAALGIDITKNHISLVVVNLQSQVLAHNRARLSFELHPRYWATAATLAQSVMEQAGIADNRYLGAGISIPGIVDEKGRSLTYSHVLKTSALTPAAFEQELGLACRLCNDANAAGIAEMWKDQSHQTALYLSLSNSVGGAVIMENMPLWGQHGRCGEFGHLTLVPDGRPCYCGRNGCVDAYCNAALLSRYTRGNLQEFFRQMEAGDTQLREAWQDYLGWLATAVNNLTTTYDSPIILGGYLGAYLEPYLPTLRALVADRATFAGNENSLRGCCYQKEAAAVGAALLWIGPFLKTI